MSLAHAGGISMTKGPILSLSFVATTLAAATSCTGEDPNAEGEPSVNATLTPAAPSTSVTGVPSTPNTVLPGTGGAPVAMPGIGGAPGTGGMPAVPGGGGMQNPDAPSFGEISYLLNLSCANIVCHVPRDPVSEPNLLDNDGMLYDRLTSYTVEACGGVPLVAPGSPGGSAILMLIQHQCGDLVMPDGCTNNPCLFSEDVDRLTAWINAGAPR